jgi:hypothetical protein
MEEKKEKLSYEQLENVAKQLQQRVMMAENRLRGIDYASMRLTWLFKVLENKDVFPASFVEKCSNEVVELLTIEEETTDEQAGEVD